MLDSATILLFIISFLDLVLGLFVLLKHPKSRANISFAFLALSILVWINASFYQDEVSTPAYMFSLLKIDFASGLCSAFFLLLFCLDISKTAIAKRLSIRIAAFSMPVLGSLLIFFTTSILSGFEIVDGIIIPVFGNVYPVYVFFIGSALCWGIGSLIWKYKGSTNEDRAKFIYLLVGLFLSSTIAFVTNILMSDGIKDNFYSRFGSFSAIFVVLFSGYAIVKHRLFNLKVIATETLSLGILVFSLIQLLRSHRAELLSNAAIFSVLLVFVIMLVRSVENEVRRKEELKLLSNKLVVANGRLRELDEARAEFMSMASHQLQTPLTAIRGFASLLLEKSGGELTPEQADMIRKISLSSERMVQLVEDYLNLSRIESGKLQYKFEEWRMEDICQDVIDTLALKAAEKNLSLTFHRPTKPLPAVMIDGPKVREVISNLVDNAVKYTPAGNVALDIRLRQRAEDEITDWIRVTVSDTGMGISEAELTHLFAKFSRGINKERLKIKGTGLGLYVGKVMIENNGGRIWAESDGEGKGSRFVVELPIKGTRELLQR